MKTTLKHLVLLAAILAVAACSRTPAPATDSASATAVPATVQADQAAAAAKAAQLAVVPFDQAVVTVTEVLESDPSLVGLSAEEAKWLSDHGYPTGTELANLLTYDVNQLLEKSREQQDVKATTLLGLRRLQDGDARGAARSLDYAARLGSIYAREQMAFAELQSNTGYKPGSNVHISPTDQVLFVARMETARILGDHRVDRYINEVAGNLDRAKYSAAILAQTTEFMRQIGEDAAIKGIRPPGPNPRPNQELWEKIQQTPGTGSIAVFRIAGGG